MLCFRHFCHTSVTVVQCVSDMQAYEQKLSAVKGVDQSSPTPQLFLLHTPYFAHFLRACSSRLFVFLTSPNAHCARHCGVDVMYSGAGAYNVQGDDARGGAGGRQGANEYVMSNLCEEGEEDAHFTWVELRCVEAGGVQGVGDAIVSISADPHHELIWVATNSGYIHAHLASDMRRVISVYHDQVRSLQACHSAILLAAASGLIALSRGGVTSTHTKADTISDAHAVAPSPLHDSHACIAGNSRMLAVVDFAHARILRQAPLRAGSGVTCADWIAPSAASSLALFGTATGRISLCDPASMREVSALAAFPAGVTSISSTDFYIAATGLTAHGGVSYVEQCVKLFDIRALHTPLPSIPFAHGPLCCAFDEHASTAFTTGHALWALSSHGVLQCFETPAVATAVSPVSTEIHLDANMDSFTCMAVSQQGLLLIADSGGFVHQWSASERALINAHSEPLWSEQQLTKEPPAPTIQMAHFINAENGAQIPRVPLFAPHESPLLSEFMFRGFDDPPRIKHAPTGASGGVASAGAGGIEAATAAAEKHRYVRNGFGHKPFTQFPLRIKQDVLREAKQQSFVGYAQAPAGFVRNSHSGHEPFPRLVKPVRRETLRAAVTPAGDEQGSSTVEKHNLDKPSVRSRYVEMDLVAYESIEGFDFLRYNRSGMFCGLENALPNVYVNAAVQALYFTPPLRDALLSHSCDREGCITCELGFLFHMIDLGDAGSACEAGNFTKAFMTMANAEALGLLDGRTALPPSQRIENFTRYLLEQLHKDEDSQGDTTVSALFGADVVSFGRFSPSKTDWQRPSRPFQHTLAYDDTAEPARNMCELLSRSLCRTLETTRAYCESSGQFEIMTQRRVLRSLPNVMLLGCSSKAPKAAAWWSGGLEKPYKDFGVESMRSPSSADAREKVAQAAMQRNALLLEAIRVEIGDSSVNVVDIGSEEADDGVAYGYDRMHEEANTCSVEGADSFKAEYDLSFVVAYVPPTKEDVDSSSGTVGTAGNVEGHLVAYIRVPAEYKKRKGSAQKVGCDENNGNADAKWWCFNDFVISPCESFSEVASFDSQWKVPCLLGYVRRDVGNHFKAPIRVARALTVREVIGSASENAAIGLAPDEETPSEGSLFALDCEFVMTGRDEAEIWGDGTRRVVNPAKMALARVSVIRGRGPRKGTALIDDYVQVHEPVVDYLTRFSGLCEGDLDPNQSRYTVRSLKNVYKRLRCLVDAGCIFIGHGLKKDFRIINFVVPSRQVIDTVTLFHIPHKRMLSLRFLTSIFLKGDIQMHTHDSVEDADAALRLYDLYLQIHGDGSDENKGEKFQKMLKELYTYGYRHAWKVDADEPFLWEHTLQL